jgi:tripartite-type tricarboxylate transporter receptor subunit TctC
MPRLRERLRGQHSFCARKNEFPPEYFSPPQLPLICSTLARSASRSKGLGCDPVIQRVLNLQPGSKTMSRFFRLVQVLLLAMSAAAFPSAHGQGYPEHPLRIIVPYPPGGGTDAVIRPLADTVSAKLGQPVVIDNRPGGNTFIGMNACAKAPADGYTLCVTNADSLSFGPLVFSKIPYDPARDLVGITKLAATPTAIVISGQLPFNTLPEVLAYARANPGKLNFGSFGTGTVGHLYAEWFRRQMKADMTHVPYRGAAPIIPALINNEVQVSWMALSLVLPHVKTGRIKVVALDYPGRIPQLPDVPTLAELNADPNIQSYFGLYAPAGTPPAVLERLNAVFKSALLDPKVQESLAGLLFVSTPTSISDFNNARRDEVEHARQLTTSIGLKPTDLPQ